MTYLSRALGEEERERRERKWEGSERYYVWSVGGGVRNYNSGFEGSQVVPACPSGRRNAYVRN
jgi:hypothetical protein